MAKYAINNERIVDTDLATKHWISSGETLYLSSLGNYYLVVNGNRKAAMLNKREAAIWFIVNNQELPQDLKPYAQGIVE